MNWLADITLPIGESAFWVLILTYSVGFGGWLIRVHVKLNELMQWKVQKEAQEKEYKDLDRRLTVLETHQAHILDMLKKIDEKLEKM